MSSPELNAVIMQRIELSKELIILKVKPKGWEFPDFKPGQYTVLGLPAKTQRHLLAQPEVSEMDPEKFIRRSYSIASSPLERQWYIEFYLVMVPEGALTPRLLLLERGDNVFLSDRVVGKFTLDDIPENSNLIFVSTGTGLAPFISMLRTYFHTRIKGKVAVLHGVRHSWDLAYREELQTIERLSDRFAYFPIVSRPNEELLTWQGYTGHLQKIFHDNEISKKWGFEPTSQNTHIFLCGSPAMIEDTMTLLGHKGFIEHKSKTPGQIHVEKYW